MKRCPISRQQLSALLRRWGKRVYNSSIAEGNGISSCIVDLMVARANFALRGAKHGAKAKDAHYRRVPGD